MAEGGTENWRQEFNRLFKRDNFVEYLQNEAKSCRLGNSRLRGLCWRIFTEVLPGDIKEWNAALREQRQIYGDLKRKFNIDPRLDLHPDIVINNPLSTSDSSLWHQYFQDKLLKEEIEKDVVRTYPGRVFFQMKRIRKSMINILFVYARQFSDSKYFQGMHELLAPIVYVIFQDIESYETASQEENIEPRFRLYFDSEFFEHDCFTIFVKVMKIAAPWYTVDEDQNKKPDDSGDNSSPTPGDSSFSAENLPQAPDDSAPGEDYSLPMVLNAIWGNLVKENDQSLYDHLNSFEIPPQYYGIRWLKLLFGREFEFSDLFIVWDCILSDFNERNLYKFIFVAMLISVRDILLNGNYTTCIKTLMTFPHVKSVKYIIELAFHLRNPTEYRHPDQSNTSKVELLNNGNKSSGSLETSRRPEVKSFFGASSLGRSFLRKNEETRPKTLQLKSENVTFSTKTGEPPKSSSVENKTAEGCSRCADFEYLDRFHTHKLYKIWSRPPSVYPCFYETFPRTKIHNVMGGNDTVEASDVLKMQKPSTPDGRSSETPSCEMETIVPPVGSVIPDKDIVQCLLHCLDELKKRDQHCIQVLDNVLLVLKNIAANQEFRGATTMIFCLNEMEKIRAILDDEMPFPGQEHFIHKEVSNSNLEDGATIGADKGTASPDAHKAMQ